MSIFVEHHLVRSSMLEKAWATRRKPELLEATRSYPEGNCQSVFKDGEHISLYAAFRPNLSQYEIIQLNIWLDAQGKFVTQKHTPKTQKCLRCRTWHLGLAIDKLLRTLVTGRHLTSYHWRLFKIFCFLWFWICQQCWELLLIIALAPEFWTSLRNSRLNYYKSKKISELQYSRNNKKTWHVRAGASIWFENWGVVGPKIQMTEAHAGPD